MYVTFTLQLKQSIMTIYLMIVLSTTLLISYIAISLSKPDEFRIKQKVFKISPLLHKYTIEKKHKIFKIWIGPLCAENNGKIMYSLSKYTWTDELSEAQELLDNYTKWLNHKDKYFEVQYSINTKENE